MHQESRTVKISLTEEQIQAHYEKAGAEQFWQAIGRLSTWGMSYKQVEIYPDGTDMIAVFKNENEQKANFVIGAVWHGNQYGFHS